MSAIGFSVAAPVVFPSTSRSNLCLLTPVHPFIFRRSFFRPWHPLFNCCPRLLLPHIVYLLIPCIIRVDRSASLFPLCFLPSSSLVFFWILFKTVGSKSVKFCRVCPYFAASEQRFHGAPIVFKCAIFSSSRILPVAGLSGTNFIGSVPLSVGRILTNLIKRRNTALGPERT